MTDYPVVRLVTLCNESSTSGNLRVNSGSNPGDIYNTNAKEKPILQQLLDAMNEIKRQNATTQRQNHVTEEMNQLFQCQLDELHKRVITIDLFDVRQKVDESLKEYLTGFNEATEQAGRRDQSVFSSAFRKGLLSGYLSESLELRRPMDMDEVHARAKCCIAIEEIAKRKRHREMQETQEQMRMTNLGRPMLHRSENHQDQTH